VSGSNFNPRNIQYIPVVKILDFLELEQNKHLSKVSASIFILINIIMLMAVGIAQGI